VRCAVIPGGESTTLLKLLKDMDLWEPLGRLPREGKAVFGTCAALILMAEEVTTRPRTRCASCPSRSSATRTGARSIRASCRAGVRIPGGSCRSAFETEFVFIRGSADRRRAGWRGSSGAARRRPRARARRQLCWRRASIPKWRPMGSREALRRAGAPRPGRRVTRAAFPLREVRVVRTGVGELLRARATAARAGSSVRPLSSRTVRSTGCGRARLLRLFPPTLPVARCPWPTSGRSPPDLAGRGGAGTIFFGGCNLLLRLLPEQSDQPSPASPSPPAAPGLIADEMLRLEREGCHNIEWVTPLI